MPVFASLYTVDNVQRKIDDPAFNALRGQKVMIWSGEHNAYWGRDRAGYYESGSQHVGLYLFEDAYRFSGHTGPEKDIIYELVESMPDPGPYRAERCPCGHRACSDWHVWPVAAIQGVKFTENQAKFVAGVLNLERLNPTASILSVNFMTKALEAISNRDRESVWRPITTAPSSAGLSKNRYVLVRGPSRMIGVKHFVVLAYHDDHYRPHDPWRFIDNSALSDFGWVPEEWAEVPE